MARQSNLGCLLEGLGHFRGCCNFRVAPSEYCTCIKALCKGSICLPAFALLLALAGCFCRVASCSRLPEYLHHKVSASLLAWFTLTDPERSRS